MLRFFIVSLILGLTGCTLLHTKNTLSQEFVGHAVSEAVIKLGPPTTKMDLGNGRMAFDWLHYSAPIQPSPRQRNQPLRRWPTGLLKAGSRQRIAHLQIERPLPLKAAVSLGGYRLRSAPLHTIQPNSRASTVRKLPSCRPIPEVIVKTAPRP
jgi:hypothetical protein